MSEIPSTAAVRVALPHFGDVSNFGDVLFPLLVARELRERIPSAAIDFISPTGAGPEASIRYDAANLGAYDAIVVAGGEVVHRYDGVLRAIYERLGLRSIAHPTDLVFGWTDLAGPYKAWFGLGVPRLDQRGRDAVQRHAPGLDRIVVRGTGSARRLGAAGGTCTVGPDLGWLFPRLRTGSPDRGARYAVLHVLPHNVPDLRVIVDPLEALRRHGLEIVLLPLSTCWEDQTILLRIAQRTGFRCVDHRTPELTKLQILGACDLYIGQSMHGFITTLASGHAAGLCFPIGDDKFSELLSDEGLEDLRVGSWEELPQLIARLLAVPRTRIDALRSRLAARASTAFDELAADIVRHAALRGAPSAAGPA